MVRERRELDINFLPRLSNEIEHPKEPNSVIKSHNATRRLFLISRSIVIRVQKDELSNGGKGEKGNMGEIRRQEKSR